MLIATLKILIARIAQYHRDDVPYKHIKSEAEMPVLTTLSIQIKILTEVALIPPWINLSAPFFYHVSPLVSPEESQTPVIPG